MIRDYRDLIVYKRSFAISVEMYRTVRRFPRDELYGLISEIKRASTSIPLNIAEGYGKKESENEFKMFLLMAIGSCNEMRVLLELSLELGYIQKERYVEYEEIGKMLTALRKNGRAVSKSVNLRILHLTSYL